MKRLILMIGVCLSFFCVTVSAQKKEIATAMDQVKKGQNLSQAQASMEKLLKDSANQDNKKIWAILYEAVRNNMPQVMRNSISNSHMIRQTSSTWLVNSLSWHRAWTP